MAGRKLVPSRALRGREGGAAPVCLPVTGITGATRAKNPSRCFLELSWQGWGGSGGTGHSERHGGPPQLTDPWLSLLLSCASQSQLALAGCSTLRAPGASLARVRKCMSFLPGHFPRARGQQQHDPQPLPTRPVEPSSACGAADSLSVTPFPLSLLARETLGDSHCANEIPKRS